MARGEFKKDSPGILEENFPDSHHTAPTLIEDIPAMPAYKIRPIGTLKEAVTTLVKKAGALDAAAAASGVSKSALHRYSDPDHDRHMPVNLVEALERIGGRPYVTEYLAAKAHHLLLPLPREESSDARLNIDLAQTGDQVARLCRDWAAALANDDIIDSEEAKVLLKRHQELVTTLMRMRTDLEARAAQDVKGKKPSVLTDRSRARAREAEEY